MQRRYLVCGIYWSNIETVESHTSVIVFRTTGSVLVLSTPVPAVPRVLLKAWNLFARSDGASSDSASSAGGGSFAWSTECKDRQIQTTKKKSMIGG